MTSAVGAIIPTKSGAWFTGALQDLMGDAAKYIEEARKRAARPCADCGGTGKIPLPTDPDTLQRTVLLAALASMPGVRTSAKFPGDDCWRCDGSGKTYPSDGAILEDAATEAARFWEKEFREAFERDDAESKIAAEDAAQERHDNSQFGVGA